MQDFRYIWQGFKHILAIGLIRAGGILYEHRVDGHFSTPPITVITGNRDTILYLRGNEHSSRERV